MTRSFYRRFALAAACLGGVLALLSPAAPAQEAQRTILGQVLDPDGKAVANAIVYLKNSTTKEELTVVTNKAGRYQFNALEMKEDFELHAEAREMKSRLRKVSQFDTRERVVINLKLEPPDKPEEEKKAEDEKKEEPKDKD